jgi:hypothetical protein
MIKITYAQQQDSNNENACKNIAILLHGRKNIATLPYIFRLYHIIKKRSKVDSLKITMRLPVPDKGHGFGFSMCIQE